MIDALLQAWQSALEPMRAADGLLEGYESLTVGHEQPIATDMLPGISLDWLREVPGSDSFQPGVPARERLEFSARIYVSSLAKGNAPAKSARDWYWRSVDGQQKGLRPALRQVVRLRVKGEIYLLTAGEARPLRKAQFPEARWSSALEALVIVRAVVA